VVNEPNAFGRKNVTAAQVLNSPPFPALPAFLFHCLFHSRLMSLDGVGYVGQLAQGQALQLDQAEPCGLDEANKVSASDDDDFPPDIAAGSTA